MAEYYVEVPVTGKMIGTVIADSEEEAIQRFIDTNWRCGEPMVDPEEKFTQDMDFEELELHKQVNQGNVCYSPIGEAYAEEA